MHKNYLNTQYCRENLLQSILISEEFNITLSNIPPTQIKIESTITFLESGVILLTFGEKISKCLTLNFFKSLAFFKYSDNLHVAIIHLDNLV